MQIKGRFPSNKFSNDLYLQYLSMGLHLYVTIGLTVFAYLLLHVCLNILRKIIYSAMETKLTNRVIQMGRLSYLEKQWIPQVSHKEIFMSFCSIFPGKFLTQNRFSIASQNKKNFDKKLSWSWSLDGTILGKLRKWLLQYVTTYSSLYISTII